MASTLFATTLRVTLPKKGHLSLNKTHVCNFKTKTTSHMYCTFCQYYSLGRMLAGISMHPAGHAPDKTYQYFAGSCLQQSTAGIEMPSYILCLSQNTLITNFEP
jgi:hypothetical protein